MCSVPDKTVTNNCTMDVLTICDVLIFFFFLLLSSGPCSSALVLLEKIAQWCLHSTCCIWWQKASQWPSEPAGFPQVTASCTLPSEGTGRAGRRAFLLQEMIHHNALPNFVFFYVGPNLKTEIGYKSPLLFGVTFISTILTTLGNIVQFSSSLYNCH